MSVYVGKSLDVFDYVWNLWMKSAGVSAYIHADVLSFRCFAFSCGEDIKKWFSPAQPVKMALVELFDNLEIAENCSIVPASDWHKYLSESECPILLADICTGMENATALRHYYHGASPFSLLHQHSDRQHLIYASAGIPYMELTEEQIRDKISASNGYIVIGKMPLQITLPSAGEILHRGMQWRKSTGPNRDRLERSNPNLFKKIQSRTDNLAIQYGLMNYQVQLSKMIRFCVQEIGISIFTAEELNNILLRIPQIQTSHKYEQIICIEEEFWALIGNIEEACHV